MNTVRQGKDFLEKVSITQFDSGFEPDIFKESFKEGWLNYEHVLNTEIVESDVEYDSNDSEEEAKDNEKKLEKKDTIVLSKPNIIPENFWIN